MPPNTDLLQIHQDTRPGVLHPSGSVSGPPHCILRCQEAFSAEGPGLQKLGRAVIMVVYEYNCLIKVLGWLHYLFHKPELDWLGFCLSLSFNISRFWNWKNKIFHSREEGINLGSEPRWCPQTVYFLHWNEVSASVPWLQGLALYLAHGTVGKKGQELGVGPLWRALTRKECST